MMNLLPFYDNDIAETLISSEIYEYFYKNIFKDFDLGRITMDDLIDIFSNKPNIEKCKTELSMTTEDFFSYIVYYLKDEINLKQLTRSKKKIQQLHDIIHDIPWFDSSAFPESLQR